MSFVYTSAPGALSCHRVRPTRPLPSLREDVLRGFAQTPRRLPPKYFYDAYGSTLFERICDTPEYYPTRAEDELLARHAREIIEEAAPEHLIEFGSGSARKTRHLLNACGAVTYWPFDVCEEMLLEAGERLRAEYAELAVSPLVGDYLGGLAGLPRPRGRRLFVFLGGTIGNFEPAEARLFLRELRAQMGPADHLLLGADRVKATDVLEAAYNDAAGVTAEFNLNVLRVLNRELDADFDLDGFRHRAIYNPRAEQIEMYLIALQEQTVRVRALQRSYQFAEGEPILTEISRKFSRKGLAALLGGAGLGVVRQFEGGEQLFSLTLARPTEALPS